MDAINGQAPASAQQAALPQVAEKRTIMMFGFYVENVDDGHSVLLHLFPAGKSIEVIYPFMGAVGDELRAALAGIGGKDVRIYRPDDMPKDAA